MAQTMVSRIDEKTRMKISGLSRAARILKALSFYVPVIILTLLVLMAIFAQWLAPYSFNEQSLVDRLKPPSFVPGDSGVHILGTDHLGRDILSRIIYGARISLSVSLLVIAITAAIGTVLGIVAGYLGGRTDALLMRITDVALSFPPILIAMLLATALGPSFKTVVIALSILGWAGYARLIRGETLRLRDSDFVAQARIIGASPFRIMLMHVFPNVLNPLIVMMTLAVGMMILIEAGMSYLGVGIPPPNPSWGSMVSDGRNLIDTAWWISFFPGLAIGLVVMSGNFFGDWLRDKMDPRLRQL